MPVRLQSGGGEGTHGVKAGHIQLVVGNRSPFRAQFLGKCGKAPGPAGAKENTVAQLSQTAGGGLANAAAGAGDENGLGL
ncbi:hypothetical protein GCM10010254_68170 [Streptomyces chromofuscus]|nr:hypothetical protein GCM10010254_68170 [Streptomyces chromofuscus]